MAVDFSSESFITLSKKEKRDIVITEFTRCRDDFEYYLNNYAYIRHPNAGLIQMKPFEYQLDVAIPVAKTLKHRRSDEALAELQKYKFKFDYTNWWKELAEEKLDLAEKIPPEFHHFHKVTSKHEEYNLRVDTILLKSRQTGLSTIFQQVCVWHTNFHGMIYDLVLSQTDREAKKFLNSCIASYELIPAPMRARKLNANEHELWLSISGNKDRKSGIQALPPTSDAGRSYDPNLVVLDEFAMYRKAEEVWTAISMSVSAGGIIVIISTPRGMGNLYHKIWEMTNKSLSVLIKNPLLEDKKDGEAALSVFRPMVVHWSQLPQSEFTRRGFATPLAWYNHMKAKISMEKGERAVAQELDLDFLSSGNTIDSKTIKALRENSLEVTRTDIKVLKEIKGLVVYTPPEEGYEYIMGIDTGEGVYEDGSVIIVWRYPKEMEAIPIVVARFTSNSHSVRQFTEIVMNTGILYNKAWMNIERNNHGHVLLSYFIEDGLYDQDKIMNRYDAVKAVFVKGVKGWNSQYVTRSLLLTTFLDHINELKDELNYPLEVADELKTFVQGKKGKWDAQEGTHDDHIIASGLTLILWKLLPKYKQFLIENSESYLGSENIDDDMWLSSSNFLPMGNQLIPKTKVKDREVPLLAKKEVDFERAKREFNEKGEENIRAKRPKTLQQERIHHDVSEVIDYEDDDIDTMGIF